MASQFAVDNIGSIVQMVLDAEKAANPELARKAVVDHIKGAARRYTTSAANLGTEVHAACEAIAKGEDPGPIHPDVQGFVDGFHRFLDKFQPEFLWIEQTVFSHQYGYAGTADALMRIDGEIVLGDWKSGKSTYPEAALQLSLYQHADYVLELVDPEPSVTSLGEPTIRQVPLPEIDGAMVLHLRPDHAEVVPLDTGDEVFETALALMHVQRWVADLSKRVLGKPLDV